MTAKSAELSDCSGSSECMRTSILFAAADGALNTETDLSMTWYFIANVHEYSQNCKCEGITGIPGIPL